MKEGKSFTHMQIHIQTHLPISLYRQITLKKMNKEEKWNKRIKYKTWKIGVQMEIHGKSKLVVFFLAFGMWYI